MAVKHQHKDLMRYLVKEARAKVNVQAEKVIPTVPFCRDNIMFSCSILSGVLFSLQSKMTTRIPLISYLRIKQI